MDSRNFGMIYLERRDPELYIYKNMLKQIVHILVGE
jgi:hypothetical protein